MLLGREKELVRRNSSQSKDKNKSMVRVASSSKLPKDFFKQDTVENRSCPTPNMLEFTFMKPMEASYSTKVLKKCSRELKSKHSLKLNLDRTSLGTNKGE